MAKTIKYESFKRGDTPVFAFTFTAPVVGYSWTGTTADFALTAVAAPKDNTGAAAIRSNVALTTNANGSASYSAQLTVTESQALVPDTDYSVEVQLKDNSGANVATVATGVVTVLQDYVI